MNANSKSEIRELTVVERAAVALGTADHEKELLVLVTKYADITAIKNAAGREQCHSAYMELKNTRVAIQKAAKDAREDANQFSKAVIAEAERLSAITTDEEVRLQALRDDYDAEVAREKAAKLAAEQQRVAAIRARIDLIRNTPASWLNKPSHEISAAADHLSEAVISLDGWAEFTGEACAERDHAVKQLREMQARQQEVEAESRRLAEERAAFALEQAAAAERERVAAAERAEQERIAQAERDRVAAVQREEQERAAALLREQQAEHARQVEAQQAELDAQKAELDRQQAAIVAAQEAQAQAARDEQARKDAEEQARLDAIAAAQRLEADHANALLENAAYDALLAAQAETRRQEQERHAAEAERVRREHVNFIVNGPGDVAMVRVIAAHFDVTVGDAMQWFKKFDYDAADEQLAAENGVEKAA